MEFLEAPLGRATGQLEQANGFAASSSNNNNSGAPQAMRPNEAQVGREPSDGQPPARLLVEAGLWSTAATSSTTMQRCDMRGQQADGAAEEAAANEAREQQQELRHSSIEQQRLMSGRNRLGTPRHGFGGGGGGGGGGGVESARLRRADNSPLIDLSGATSGAELSNSETGTLQMGANQASESETCSSLASNLNQAPPSYKTATQTCVSLATQVPGASFQFDQVAQLEQRQQQHQHQRAKNHSDSYGFLKFVSGDKDQRWAGQVAGAQARPPENGHGNGNGFGSGAGMANAAAVSVASRRRDEGIYATLNAVALGQRLGQEARAPLSSSSSPPLPPPLPLPHVRLPINHVISAGASMQQQPQQHQQQQQQWPTRSPQTNQLQHRPEPTGASLMGAHQTVAAGRMSNSRTLPHSFATPTGANSAAAAAASHNRTQGRQQPQQQLAYSTLSSSRLLVAHSARQSEPANRWAQSDLGGLYASASNQYKAPIVGASGGGGDDDGQLCAAGQATTTTSTRLARREQAPHQNQHRKRKRHRSASGQFLRNQQQQAAAAAAAAAAIGVSCGPQRIATSAQAKDKDAAANHLEAGRVLCAPQAATSAPEADNVTTISHRQAGGPAAAPAAISAHCWLIDSSDDNCQRERRDCAPSASGAGAGASGTAKAKTRSDARKADTGPNDEPYSMEPPSCALKGLGTQPDGMQVASSVARISSDRANPSGMPSGHRTRTLEREKWRRARRNHCARRHHSNGALDQANRDRESSDSCWPTTRASEQQRPLELSTSDRNRRPARAQQRRAARGSTGTLARLSSLLSVVSSLVSVGSKSKSGRANELPSQAGRFHDQQRQFEMPYSLPSVSSVAASSRRDALQATRGGSGRPSSLAYSSSTNTSAYVTGSSSLQSAAAAANQLCTLTAAPLPASNSQRLAPLVQLNCSEIFHQQQQQQTSMLGANDRTLAYHLGSSLSSGALADSAHSYEYCEQEAGLAPSMSTECAYNLRRLGAGHFEQIELAPLQMRPEFPSFSANMNELAAVELNGEEAEEAEAEEPSATDSSYSGSASSGRCRSMSPAQLVGLNQAALSDQSRLARILLSDNELISATSEPVEPPPHPSGPLSSGSSGARRRLRMRGAIPAASRRRWWWNSLKLWLIARLGGCPQRTLTKLAAGQGAPPTNSACFSASSSSDDHRDGRQNGQSSRAAPLDGSAPSYRALKSTQKSRNGRARSAASAPSTLQNVISLAKVDRVFRCRLLASLFVSLVLLVLICLLANLIYRTQSARPAPFLGQANLRALNGANGRLSLLMDDSDFDLAWLWPGQQRGAGPASEQQLDERGKSTHTTGSLREASEAADGGGGGGSSTGNGPPSLDANLKSLLHLIDRSERLQQFQLVVTHLTNMQLAQDQFVDIGQLSAALVRLPAAAAAAAAESQNTSSSNGDQNKTIETRLARVSQNQLDLASLTLLSNLHWPLVKWRHQSQQSLAANLFSFALSPATPTVSFGAAQTVRNLLSSLILAESLGAHATAADHVNLQQFRRLLASLRTSAYHLLVCSASAGMSASRDDEPAPASLFSLAQDRFCRLLVARYRRLMILLGQMNQADLADLHGQQAQQPASIFASADESKFSRASHAAGSRNVLAFLLDRLALIDARTVAELTLASLQDEDSLSFDSSSSGEPSWLGQDLDEQENELVESLLTVGRQWELEGPVALANEPPAAEGGQGQLFELLKTIVGESAASWMGQQEEQTQGQLEQYRASLEQLRSKRRHRWLELLTRDLLDVWPAQRLASFARPQNYDLFLHPNLSTRLIYGMNKIEFELLRPTRFIVLHCQQLNVIEVKLWAKQPADWGGGGGGGGRSAIRALNATGSSASAQRVESPLRQVPIRRVLLTREKLLLVELHELIEPLGSGPKWGSHEAADLEARARHSSPSIEFGELPALIRADQHHAPTAASSSQRAKLGAANRTGRPAATHNQFVLSISFNKTNLADRVFKGDATRPESVAFVDYADLFGSSASAAAAASASLISDQVGPENQQAAAGSSDRSQLKRLLLSELAHSARRLFPCFDEPKFRATFQLNLVHDHAQQAVFNTQRRERIPYNANGQLQMSVFEQTPFELSASSVAFVICELHNIKTLTSKLVVEKLGQQLAPAEATGHAHDHVQVQVWAQFMQLSQAEYASQLTPQLLAFYQNHLHFAYPLDKLDLVAVPAPARAKPRLEPFGMASSLGLLSFDESLLLVDANLVSQDLLERVSLLQSRQLARLYFGQTISAHEQRRDGWLVEALAEYLEPLALAETQPDWHLDEQQPLSSIRDALELVYQLEEPAANLPDAELAIWSGQDQVEILEADRRPTETDEQDEHQRRATARARRGRAVLHMLLMNLLPTSESRARLLRRLLDKFRYKTLTTRQFWHQFGAQLLLDSSTAPSGAESRLPLDMQPTALPADAPDAATGADLEPQANPSGTTTTTTTTTTNHSERVVFIHRQPAARPNAWSPLDDTHQVHAAERTHETAHFSRWARATWRPAESLELVAQSWLDRAGFPLISASCYRDRLQLRQERFGFARRWWRPQSRPTTIETEAGELEVGANSTPTGAVEEPAPVESEEAPVWPVPLMFVSRLNVKKAGFLWLSGRQMEFPLQRDYANSGPPMARAPDLALHHHLHNNNNSKLPAQYTWFKLNHNQTSLARVNYDERNWEALIGLLSRSHYSNHLLNPLDRANLLDDALVLMRHGQLSVGLAMNLTLYLELGERDFQPWRTALSHLDELQSLLNQNPLWHKYVLKLIQPISVVIGWKDDGPHLMRKLRRELFSVAIRYGDEKIVAKARADFRLWAKSASQFVVPNLQELVYVAGVRYGDQQEWFHCWQKYQALVALDQPAGKASESGHYSLAGADSQTSGKPIEERGWRSNVEGANLAENEKRQLLTALASTQNTWLLEQFLNYSLDAAKIEPHHLKRVVQTLGKNPVARLYLWRFVRLNWFALQERFLPSAHISETQRQPRADDDQDQDHHDDDILATMILESTRHFATRLDYDELKTFFDSKLALFLQSRAAPAASGGPRASGEAPDQDDANSRQAADARLQWGRLIGGAVARSLWTIENNIHWRDSIEPKLTRWLSQHSSIN